jgi:hypothetical protein
VTFFKVLPFHHADPKARTAVKRTISVPPEFARDVEKTARTEGKTLLLSRAALAFLCESFAKPICGLVIAAALLESAAHPAVAQLVSGIDRNEANVGVGSDAATSVIGGLTAVGIGSSPGTSNFWLIERPGFGGTPAVSVLYPNFGNAPMVLDVYPHGAPDPASYEPYGVSWLDTCDTDFTDSTISGRCIHLGARENFLEVGSRTYSFGSTPTSVKDLHLTVGIDNYNNDTDTIRDGIIINGSSGQVSAPQGFYTPIGMPGYKVLTLPAGVKGQRAYVTDAISCLFLGAVTGGGSTFCPVVFNGSKWVGG